MVSHFLDSFHIFIFILNICFQVYLVTNYGQTGSTTEPSQSSQVTPESVHPSQSTPCFLTLTKVTPESVHPSQPTPCFLTLTRGVPNDALSPNATQSLPLMGPPPRRDTFEKEASPALRVRRQRKGLSRFND